MNYFLKFDENGYQSEMLYAQSAPEGFVAAPEEFNPSSRYKLTSGIMHAMTDADAAAQAALQNSELHVPVRRYVMELLGTRAYSSLKIARLGLQAKFQAGTASAAEIQTLGALEAAADLMQMGSTVNLKDPIVAAILDIAIAIPAVGLTQADKERILRNEALSA